MFHLLETMKQVELNQVMRNPIEISNLLLVTQNFLKGQQTVYKHQREKETILNEKKEKEGKLNQKEKLKRTTLTSSSVLERQITESGYRIDG